MLTTALLATATTLVVFSIALLYRAIKGPTMQDRVIAVNVLGTNTVVILAVLAVALESESFLDIALVYALLNFIMAIAISKFTVKRGDVI